MPDLFRPHGGAGGGQVLCGGYVSLPVRNTGSRGWIRGLVARSLEGAVDAEVVHVDREGGGVGAAAAAAEDSTEQHAVGPTGDLADRADRASSVDVAPGQLRLVAVRLTVRAEHPVRCGSSVRLELTGSAEGSAGGTAVPLRLRVQLGPMQCRAPEQSVVCTLIDHDGAISVSARRGLLK